MGVFNFEGEIPEPLSTHPLYTVSEVAGKEKKVTPPSTVDEIRKSQAVLQAISMIAGLPILEAPFEEASSDSNLVELRLKQHISSLICDMWEDYSEEIAKENSRRKEELFSPKYQAWLELQHPEALQDGMRSASEFNQWINSLPPEQREREIAGNIQNFLADVVSGYVEDQKESNPAAAAFMVTSLVISSAFIGDLVAPVQGIAENVLGTNPIVDGATAMNQVVPPDISQYMNLAVNLFVAPLAYQTIAESVVKPEQGGLTPTLDTAKEIASAILDKVKGNEVNQFLMALLVNKNEGDQPITPKRVQELAEMGKLVMLGVALALLYKTEAGAMTKQEFSDLVQGNLTPRSEEEKNLIKEFNQIISHLNPKEGRQIFDALAEFMGGRPSVEHLLNPLKVYQGVLAQLVLPLGPG